MKVCAVETTHSIEEAAMVLHQPCTAGSQDAEYRQHCREVDSGHTGVLLNVGQVVQLSM